MDPWRRLQQHNNPENKTFTSKFSDWSIKAVFCAPQSSRSISSFEKYIKQQKSKALIERLIDPDFIPDGVLADLVRMPLK
jgi:putative endonuclease